MDLSLESLNLGMRQDINLFDQNTVWFLCSYEILNAFVLAALYLKYVSCIICLCYLLQLETRAA